MQRFFLNCIARATQVQFVPRAGDGDDGQDPPPADDEDKDDKDGDDGQDPPPDDKLTRAELKRARDEAAKYRKESADAKKTLKSLEAKIKEFEDKDKSELQKLQDELEEQKKNNAKLSLQSKRADGVTAAVKANAHDPDVVAKLLEYDSDIDLESQIKSLKEDKPFLFRSNRSANGGNGKDKDDNSRNNKSMNDLIRGRS